MFPAKLFKIDPKTKSLVVEAACLRSIRGHGGLFEDFGNEDFGLNMITNSGIVSQWIVRDKIDVGDRLTFVLKSTQNPDHKMVVMEKY